MNARQDVTDFTWVDRSQDPSFYTRFLDLGNALEDIQASKGPILHGLELATGQRVLDVGCGMGDDVVAIAERVGVTGKAVGVDLSENMIREAKKRHGGLANVEFIAADGVGLPFADATFDGVRAERLFMHVPDADRVLGEMARVTKSGGHVSVFDFDWETFFIDHPDKTSTRLIVQSFTDNMKQGWIGRQLPGRFRAHGFDRIVTKPRVICIGFDFFELLVGGHLERMKTDGAISAAVLGGWWQTLREANLAGRFLVGFTAFIVSGSR